MREIRQFAVRGGMGCRWNNLDAELLGPGGEPLFGASEALRGPRRQFNSHANNPNIVNYLTALEGDIFWASGKSLELFDNFW